MYYQYKEWKTAFQVAGKGFVMNVIQLSYISGVLPLLKADVYTNSWEFGLLIEIRQDDTSKLRTIRK